MSNGGSAYPFDPAEHAVELEAIFGAVERASSFEKEDLEHLLRRYPKDGKGFFSKAELIRGYRALRSGSATEQTFVERVRMKPVRTRSGVAPVTVLTKPFPCPGRCIFCPSDVRDAEELHLVGTGRGSGRRSISSTPTARPCPGCVPSIIRVTRSTRSS